MQNMEHLPQQEYAQTGERITPERKSLAHRLSLLWKRFFYGADQLEINFEVERELEEGENVLWLGQPGLPKMLAGRVIFLVLAIIAILLLALVLIGLFLHAGWSLLGFFFPCIYCAFFSWMALFTVRSRWHKLRRTRYMITDQRVAIITSRKNDLTVEGYYDIKQLRRIERPDGSGDLIIVALNSGGSHQSSPGLEGRFVGIRNVRDVEVLLRRTLRQTHQA
ncbi:MAG TPA: hypothetical protein VGD98_00665 [Ktedonobacteraceae bacterium]